MIKKRVDGKAIGLANKRPIAMVVRLASQYESSIYIKSGDMVEANAKSFMSMMLMDINRGEEIVITAEGPDEKQAAEAIENFMLGR